MCGRRISRAGTRSHTTRSPRRALPMVAGAWSRTRSSRAGGRRSPTSCCRSDMLRLLLPLLAGLAALAAGVGAGMMLKAPAETVTPHDAPPPDPAAADVHAPAFMEFSNQFLIPLMRGAEDGGMIVLDLSLQATAESAAAARA